jgi:hypothetical protein
VKSLLKSLLPAGLHPRRILSGLCRGLVLELDLSRDAQMWLGAYEREIHPALRRLAAAAAAFVDIGAGAGELSLWFATCHPGRPVHAYEPDPDQRSLQQRNLKNNFTAPPPHVHIHDGFIDASPGGRPLDDITARLPTPTLVKIDTEGAEARILQSGPRLLQNRAARFLIETHSRELEESCLRLLHSAGYQTSIIPQAPWRRWLPELRPLEHNRWLAALPTPLP